MIEETLKELNKNNKKLKYLNYENWGIKISNLLITMIIVGLMITASTIAGLVFTILVLKNNTLLFLGLFILSTSILLISLLLFKHYLKVFKSMWHDFYGHAITNRGDKTVEVLTQEAFSRYVITFIVNNDFASPRFGYTSDEEGFVSNIAFANLTYNSEDYIPMIACLYAIIEEDSGNVISADITKDLNEAMQEYGFEDSQNKSLVIISHGLSDDDHLRHLIKIFKIGK